MFIFGPIWWIIRWPVSGADPGGGGGRRGYRIFLRGGGWRLGGTAKGGGDRPCRRKITIWAQQNFSYKGGWSTPSPPPGSATGGPRGHVPLRPLKIWLKMTSLHKILEYLPNSYPLEVIRRWRRPSELSWSSHCIRYPVIQSYADQWYADQWFADQWFADQWYADQWYADQWFADQWYADQWYADQWFADQWYADQWFADQWYADQWFADQWYADQWFADQWYADQWYADQWYADQWFADQWFADLSHSGLCPGVLSNIISYCRLGRGHRVHHLSRAPGGSPWRSNGCVDGTWGEPGIFHLGAWFLYSCQGAKWKNRVPYWLLHRPRSKRH